MDIAKLKIETASKNQIPELKKIWSVCFSDSDEYIDFFFNNRFLSCKTITAIYNEKTIGVVYLLPVKALEYGVIKNGWYGYAIGILPEYRGNGIYAMMHKKILNEIIKNNEFYILCPANSKLCSFYHSLGFCEYAYLKQTELKPESPAANWKLSNISYEEYSNLRNAYFEKDGFIIWDKIAIDYAVKENEFCGGMCIKISDEKSDFAVLMRKQQNSLYITESTVPLKHMQDITSFLCKKYSFDSVIWITPAYEKNDSDKFVSAMSINLKKADFPYLNLLLN